MNCLKIKFYLIMILVVLWAVSLFGQDPSVNSKFDSSMFDLDFFIKLVAIVVSALLIIWQLNRQHKNNLKLQRENNKEKLKLEIFKEYSKVITEASEKIESIHGAANSITISLTGYSTSVSMGLNPSPISQREVIFRDGHFEALKALTDLMFLLEKYEIINPNLKIFDAAFACAHYDMSKTFPPFHEILMKYLPYDVPKTNQERLGTNVMIPQIPSKDDIIKVSEIAQPYIENLLDAQTYIYDLGREAQNILLGSLFNNRIPIRKPINHKFVAISTSPEDVEKLKKYFYEETEWGKEQKKTEEEVKEAVKKENTA